MKLLHVLIIKPLIRDESVLNQAIQILLKKSWSKEGVSVSSDIFGK